MVITTIRVVDIMMSLMNQLWGMAPTRVSFAPCMPYFFLTPRVFIPFLFIPTNHLSTLISNPFPVTSYTHSTSIFPSCPYPSHTHHTHIYTHPSHASTRLTHFSPFHFVHYMQPAPLPCIPIPHSHRFHHSMQSLTIRTFHTHHFSVIHNH